MSPNDILTGLAIVMPYAIIAWLLYMLHRRETAANQQRMERGYLNDLKREVISHLESRFDMHHPLNLLQTMGKEPGDVDTVLTELVRENRARIIREAGMTYYQAISPLLDKSGHLCDEYLGILSSGVGVGVAIVGTGRFAELGDIADGRLRLLLGRRGPLRSDEHADGVRSDEHADGVRNEPHCWDFPGGGVDFREKLADTVHRELPEELGGVTLAKITQLFLIEHFPGDQHWLSVTHAALLAADSPQPSIPEAEREKCLELRFFTLDELRALPPDQLTQTMHLNLSQLEQPAYQAILLGLAPNLKL